MKRMIPSYCKGFFNHALIQSFIIAFDSVCIMKMPEKDQSLLNMICLWGDETNTLISFSMLTGINKSRNKEFSGFSFHFFPHTICSVHHLSLTLSPEKKAYPKKTWLKSAPVNDASSDFIHRAWEKTYWREGRQEERETKQDFCQKRLPRGIDAFHMVLAAFHLCCVGAQCVWAVQTLGKPYYLHRSWQSPSETWGNSISDVVTINYYKRNPMVPL